ncbi:MAG TPA: PilZ domain-containing protein [Dissulfurispiraceae bacterium]|nr:PilZ domain-containing protein [Dissulfurispiraceae bacterium]
MGTLENHLQKFLAKEERVWPRFKCSYYTECHDSRGNLWTCRIIDISYRGVGIVSSAALRAGEILSIADPKIKATVVWMAEGRAGLRICN